MTAGELVRRKLFAKGLDEEALRRFCLAVDLGRRARAELEELGNPLTDEGSKGQRRVHPLVDLARAAAADARSTPVTCC